MYESPIDVIYKDIVINVEDEIFKAVQNINIVVDRDELLKALKYDRDSYLKGFEDGSNCNSYGIIRDDVYDYLYCPKCGAKISVIDKRCQ